MMVLLNLAFRDSPRLFEMKNSAQRTAFLNGEGDAWFERNSHYEVKKFDHVDNEILLHLPKGNSVLEIGCADGRRLARIQKILGTDTKLVGIDPSTTAIKQGLTAFQGIDLRIGTADDLPKDELFETVILGFCLYLCDRALLSKIVFGVTKWTIPRCLRRYPIFVKALKDPCRIKVRIGKCLKARELRFGC